MKYDKYEWRTAANGKCYITPSADAKPSIYNPIKDYEKLVLTAINIGTTAMNKSGEPELKEAIMSFVSEYGMLGLMTALPTTPDFITYQAVYLPKNHFIKEENNSLLLCVQMMFSFMLTDENSSMKVCKHCGKAFVATRPNMEFCSPQCKNQYNVYKSRAKKNDTPTYEDFVYEPFKYYYVYNRRRFDEDRNHL